MGMNKGTTFSSFTLRCGEKLATFDRPAVMGILNITPDSFFDGGRYRTDEQIIARATTMLQEGADIIDIGAVSSRPGATLLPPDEEAARLVPAVKLLRRHFPQVLISVDTCFALPARQAIEAGANIVNDISGGAFDKQMFATVAELQVPYILMHTTTTPDHMQDNPHYDDVVESVAQYLSERLHQLRLMGVADVIIDPGFGFGKTLEHNYQLYAALPELVSLFPDTPLLVGISRKSMVYRLCDCTPGEALQGTTVLHALAVAAGAALLRVHDVKPAVDLVNRFYPQTPHAETPQTAR